MLTLPGISYNLNPSQDNLIQGIRVAQMWNIPRLFHYSLDHLKRQFDSGKIHPAIVLAVARRNAIPTLIKPSVEALASPTLPLNSWCCDDEILRHMEIGEFGVIARMKVKLQLVRFALLDVPPVIHGEGCIDMGGCAGAWELYWYMKVGKKLRRLDGEISHRLWCIRSEDVIKAQVPGMGIACLTETVIRVGDNPCWFSETRVVEGAINRLMVHERIPDWEWPNSGTN